MLLCGRKATNAGKVAGWGWGVVEGRGGARGSGGEEPAYRVSAECTSVQLLWKSVRKFLTKQKLNMTQLK